MAEPATDTPQPPTEVATYLKSTGLLYPQADLDAKRAQLDKDDEAFRAQELSRIESLGKKREDLLSHTIPAPPPPKLQDVKAAPKFEYADPMQAFKSPAIFLAALGSLFTRRPLMTAMDSATGMIKAFHEGDKEGIEIQRQNWKDSVDAAIKQNNVEIEKYKAAWENTKHSVTERQAQLQGLAAGVQDETLIAAIKSGRIERIDGLLKEREKANNQLQESLVKFEAQRAGKIDQSIINELGHYPGMAVSDLGFIAPTSQKRLTSAFESARALESIAGYAKDNPEAVGLVADAARRMNLDAYQGMFGASLKQKTDQDFDASIDRAAKDKGADLNQAAKAKILGKMLTTQAFADAAASGSRGATIYLDKAFREIYQQASSPQAFFGILEKRYDDANRVAEQYNLGFDKRTDADQKMPFWKQKAQGFVEGATGRGGAELPPAARSALKEGVETTFGNGQVWTLSGGVPKRVR